MNFAPGERLSGDERCVYEVVGEGWAAPRFDFLRARKRFWNFRYPAFALDEALLEEGLNVLVRCPKGTVNLEAFRFERERVLGGAWWPWLLEPVDVVEREPEAPLLVLADPGARVVQGGSGGREKEFDRVEGMLYESLTMLAAFRERRLIATEFGPEDFVIDGAGRWFFLGTDRVVELEQLEAPDADFLALRRCAEALLGSFGDEAARARKSVEAIHAKCDEAADALRGDRSGRGSTHWIRRLIGDRPRPKDG